MKMETNKNGKITAAILEFFNLLVASIFDIFRRWAEQHRNNIEQHPAASCSHSKNLLHFFHLHFGISEPSFFLRWDFSSIFGFLFDHRLIRFGFQRLLWLWLWFHERTQWLNAIERNWTQPNLVWMSIKFKFQSNVWLALIIHSFAWIYYPSWMLLLCKCQSSLCKLIWISLVLLGWI